MTTSVKDPDQFPVGQRSEPTVAGGGDLPDHLLRWLEAAQRRVAAGLDLAADDVVRKVPQRRLRILQLVPPEGARQKDLAERALVTKQAIAELVDALQADGLVERTPDPSDGRAWLVVRTRHGQRVSDHVDDAMRQVEDELARAVGVEQYALFKDIVRKLGENQI